MNSPLILFAPGAGAPSSSDWMRAWARRLGEIGTVTAFDYDYQVAKRRRPDPLPALVARHRAKLAEIRSSGERPVVLAGKSMGSRVGCHVSLEEHVSGLVCFGYPLKAAGSGRLRDEVLLNLTTPILFVQGTKDPLCPLPLLESVRPRMTARNELHVVEAGDHSLKVSRASKAGPPAPPRLPQDQADETVLAAVRRFLDSL